jgi:hypothetical protein
MSPTGGYISRVSFRQTRNFDRSLSSLSLSCFARKPGVRLPALRRCASLSLLRLRTGASLPGLGVRRDNSPLDCCHFPAHPPDLCLDPLHPCPATSCLLLALISRFGLSKGVQKQNPRSGPTSLSSALGSAKGAGKTTNNESSLCTLRLSIASSRRDLPRQLGNCSRRYPTSATAPALPYLGNCSLRCSTSCVHAVVLLPCSRAPCVALPRQPLPALLYLLRPCSRPTSLQTSCVPAVVLHPCSRPRPLFPTRSYLLRPWSRPSMESCVLCISFRA